jgi:hypothetical protein
VQGRLLRREAWRCAKRPRLVLWHIAAIHPVPATNAAVCSLVGSELVHRAHLCISRIQNLTAWIALECGVLQTCSRHPVYGTGSIVPEPQLRLSAVGYVQSYDRCSPDGDGKDSATPSLCQQVVRTYEFYSAGGRVYGEMACRSFGCCRLGRREHLLRSHNSGEYAVVIGSLRCGGLAEYRSDTSDLQPAGQAITTSTAARRWAGFIFSPFSELHTFRLASTDGVRLRLPAQTPMHRAEAHDCQSAIWRVHRVPIVLSDGNARQFCTISASQLLSLTQSDGAPRTVMVVAGQRPVWCAGPPSLLHRDDRLCRNYSGRRDELQNIHRSNFGDVRLTLSTRGGATRVSLGNQLLARPLEDGTLEGC